jgi:hypothetical protein
VGKYGGDDSRGPKVMAVADVASVAATDLTMVAKNAL